MVTISEFAEKHRVKVKRDKHDGDLIIPGKQFAEYRSHVFGFGAGRFGVCLILESKKRWTYAKRKLESAGFTIRQDGDTEGCATFDPNNRKQARLALKLAGVRKRKQMSPEQLAALRQRLPQRARAVPSRYSERDTGGFTNAEAAQG